MSAPKRPGLGEIADTLSDIIDLADAWATCGPEGYTLARIIHEDMGLLRDGGIWTWFSVASGTRMIGV
jgi:hypothetical protein